MLKDFSQILKEIDDDIHTLSQVELKQKYLSKSGVISKMFKELKEVPDKEKSEYGLKINQIKTLIEDNIKNRVEEKLEDKPLFKIDPTAPFDINSKKDKKPHILDLRGSSHPLMQELEKILDIFQRMGFNILESRQLDDDFHMFESLNFPKGHPARDMYDTFWTDDNFVLPAHTSTMQNRALRKFGPPPIRVVLPGRCFRNEATDASHEHTFYQIEGIYVDKDISFANMLATIKSYLEEYLEKELEIRVQPAYFPFTEPDAEFVISCPFCNKSGCSTCHYSGWIELMGCGMIHPNVLNSGGIDSQIYSGFAWGVGLDRLTAIKRGITDIRKLRDGDINFLRQF
ncbi:phenylalanine--tRNA ligase subunit alpha [candidate division WS6 bacterium RIFOXYD1_FULL_33_8]|uniref:Phenylalanine--tRNA ligase alpha subunit n=2 Tax=Candidatus Dojkabacteria TaxID=74243 RepID=A0A0G0ATL0_9BACT|nr:MAG: phenylalanyl-tRNA synthetase subunit alpha, phenylalanyl-tRNA synthetase alpha chain [candidate division WS6 bacterium GW2011_GWE2_33_157]KKP43528.1 MAG: phenylalanyl-tRNA synthetase subunit alpha, phenylalanyl-tRNA synthetase alpha chain [candidate division WS6 bacterium GW2011_GWC1_33_20]KKP45127.1 MAG: phenylalanyl-tRNA synthetase subunit alpha, phenylalanyl-tRNA synthetase alpha chain [candidate division WS6 bacterium GW2011_GWF1_33_233]KKP54400.1 MAG: phenylalanyl-tRNA synthetase su